MTKQAMINVAGLTMGWGDVILQRGATFTVEQGDVFAILGGSGCGKSTMLRYLIGLEEPMEGEIEVAGLGRPRLEAGRPPFGVMFQSGALFGSMTVGQNVALGLSTWTTLPDDAIGAIVASKLRLVGLEDAADKLPSELSGGMKKRAAIARAMALEPSLLFLDEPSAGLDPISGAALDHLISTLVTSFGLTVVIVTHELESVFSVATACILLDKTSASIIARGDPRSLRDQSSDPRVHAFLHREYQEASS